MRSLLALTIAMVVCMTLVSAEGDAAAPETVPAVVAAPETTVAAAAAADDPILKKSLRQAREERRRKLILASYCLPVLEKLKKAEKPEGAAADLSSDNCRVMGFAGGDFLTLRESLQQVPGVADVQLGFMGGWKRNPTYKEVCLGGTGHTEMVMVVFNNDTMNYTTLLESFFKAHNPRSRVQPGDFAGIQFKSVVYLLDHPQLWAFAQVKKKLDSMPEYKQDSLWVLTEPTALKERPNNFWPERGTEEELRQIRNQSLTKVQAKVKKVVDNITNVAAEAEADMKKLQAENNTNATILVEKDSGEDQRAKYNNASDADKKKIEAERNEMLTSVINKAKAANSSSAITSAVNNGSATGAGGNGSTPITANNTANSSLVTDSSIVTVKKEQNKPKSPVSEKAADGDAVPKTELPKKQKQAPVDPEEGVEASPVAETNPTPKRQLETPAKAKEDEPVPVVKKGE